MTHENHKKGLCACSINAGWLCAGAARDSIETFDLEFCGGRLLRLVASLR